MAERILIVDDSRALRMLMGHNLRQGGYEVLEAGDGAEADAEDAELAVGGGHILGGLSHGWRLTARRKSHGSEPCDDPVSRG